MTTYGPTGAPCPHCNAWVERGVWHTCSRLPAATAVKADHGFALEALLQRAVAALERIANELEGQKS